MELKMRSETSDTTTFEFVIAGLLLSVKLILVIFLYSGHAEQHVSHPQRTVHKNSGPNRKRTAFSLSFSVVAHSCFWACLIDYPPFHGFYELGTNHFQGAQCGSDPSHGVDTETSSDLHLLPSVVLGYIPLEVRIPPWGTGSHNFLLATSDLFQCSLGAPDPGYFMPIMVFALIMFVHLVLPQIKFPSYLSFRYHFGSFLWLHGVL
ncbi:hypothetical protein F5Y03DRAFT_246059 [Xylaria venustula]|nr:hypothetical protein F5Y03DRAFT_246059 [Xylaria venustula]